jgi:hypothetical protein
MSDAERVRESVLDDAVKAGKFSAERRPFYRRNYDADPKGTRALIAAMAPIPLPEPEAGADDDAYPADWFPEVAVPRPPAPSPTAGQPAYPAHWLPEVGRTGQGRIIIGGD